MCSLPAISFCFSQSYENKLELLRREAAALQSELLRGHFPTGLEKDYTVAGNSRGCWFSNPFYSTFVSAFSCVLPLGWAKHKSVLTSLLISMHETNSREGTGTSDSNPFTLLWEAGRRWGAVESDTWAWSGCCWSLSMVQCQVASCKVGHETYRGSEAGIVPEL